MKLKKFNSFLNEEISTNRLNDAEKANDYDDFISQLTNALKYDFKMNNQQTKEFLEDNKDTVKKCFDNKINYKKTLAIIKLKLDDENN